MRVTTGSSGNVFGYNESREPGRSEQIPHLTGDISLHGHYAFSNLFEGNIVQNMIVDHYWGPSGPFNTLFRNRSELYGILVYPSDSLPTAKMNIVGNEITHSDKGYYLLNGADHFQWGNRLNDSIFPAGTEILTDSSYYRKIKPGFWNIPDPWPSIGYPHALDEYSIPARERYLEGKELAVGPSVLTGWQNTPGDHPQETLLYPNPSRGILNFRDGEGPLDILLMSMEGKPLLRLQDVAPPIHLPSTLPPGVYLVLVKEGGHSTWQKLILNP
jgi:hypothetical protein